MTEIMPQNVQADEHFNLGVVHIGTTGLNGFALHEFLIKVTNWLPAYQQWVITDLGLADGKNLHAIYRLGVSLYNVESLASIAQITELAQCARAGGWPLTLSVHSRAIERDEVAFSDMLKSKSVASLVVIASANDVGAIDWELLRRAVQGAKGNGIPVSIIGDYIEIQGHVLQDRWLDDTAFTVYPRAISSPQHSRRRNCFGELAVM